MALKIGIDVGGTFTDFLVAEDGREPRIHKILSTPMDPSIAVIDGLGEIAASQQPAETLEAFAGRIDTIVHGTTVTTNATLTGNGARTGLITTAGLRDALEMRRGIREEQYNNRYTNVMPLVPRYLRAGVEGRLDREGRELEALSLDDVKDAVELFKTEGCEAVAICFMNAFANPQHEARAAELVRSEMADAYLTVSTDLLPSIRFYERVSTTVLNSYVGPKLNAYIASLTASLQRTGFGGVLLIMQSNGGVMSPEIARKNAALTLLSGPAAGPGAGLGYAGAHGQSRCITVDMGGTSFDAALVVDGPIMVNEGEIARHRIALPMLGIHTIGSGGGSVGWIDEGGLLRMGPESAGADPGPACYGKGGQKPACTDANVVLGYLAPEFFAGGKMALNADAARAAIAEYVAGPLDMSVEEAAAGMYRVICNNMAQGVREITIKRGFDPREFPMVVAGGAGAVHACQIAGELQIPFLIVPREASIFCAAGMLMCDLKHDFVRTFVSRLDQLDWDQLGAMIDDMMAAGRADLESEGIAEERQSFFIKLDCRYLKQYHEVSFEVPKAAVDGRDSAAIAALFHAEHNRLYGYSLEQEGSPVEIINVRVQGVGLTDKPERAGQDYAGPDAQAALKGERTVYVPERQAFETVPVYDGEALNCGNRIAGPAMIEEVTTSIFVSAAFDMVCDRFGSFAIYLKGREDLVTAALQGESA
ncbi:MAG: hydantoinase/oxoprolinase family protein [Alphaproteobacteria bacterium]|jgi:N-methylhydantoinase A|nr:hydantoinase/oxoprolinase family protein [Alphaproteobacteria bacterium]